MSFLRAVRTLHAWLGFFVFPWIIMIGATGIYLNNPDWFDPWLPGPSYDEARFDDWPDRIDLPAEGAAALAEAIAPGAGFGAPEADSYHGREVWVVDSPDVMVIATRDTGHYWVKEGFTRKTYDPDGNLLDTKVYWGDLFKHLHRAGWGDWSLGSWPADIAGGAMVLFGLSGIFLFLRTRLPRLFRRARPAPKRQRRDWPARL